jgi:hypothetical protein
MSTGTPEPQPWTADELSSFTADTQQGTWIYSQQLDQYLRNQIPPGPIIVTPEAQQQFYESLKKLWANFMRWQADLLDGRPLPPPTAPPPPMQP